MGNVDSKKTVVSLAFIVEIMAIRRTKMIDTEKLRSIPIEKVATLLGFELNRGSGRCRLPGHEDKNPSFSVRTQTNRFQCYACGRGGDTIELVKTMLGVDFITACRWLNERFGFSRTSQALHTYSQPSLQYQPPNANDKHDKYRHLAPDGEVFQFVLDHSPLQPDGREYLHSRFFGLSTVEKFKVGQIGGRQELQKKLLDAFGGERVAKCGLLQDGKFGAYFPMQSGYLLFPFFKLGRVVYLQSRRVAEGTGPRWLCPVGLRPPVFNVDCLSDAASTIYICEGVTDVLSAHELGIQGIGLIGASAQLDEETLTRLRGRNVAVLGDADAAGKKFSRRIVDHLSAFGITATTMSLPAGFNDLNDYLGKKKGSEL